MLSHGFSHLSVFDIEAHGYLGRIKEESLELRHTQGGGGFEKPKWELW